MIRKFFRWINLFKIGALIFIFIMALADFRTMYNLFSDLQLLDIPLTISGKDIPFTNEVFVYSLTAAILLEGNPFFMGHTASVLADKTKYKANDKINARIGLIVSFIGLTLSIILVIYLRSLQIEASGGIEAFKEGQYGSNEDFNLQFIAHKFLFWSPLLTSILAFVASWTAFRSDGIEKLERDLKDKHDDYLVAQSAFLESVHRNDDARIALWGSLSERDPMPTDLDTFRKECFDRIRSKLITNCIVEFPDQIKRYNSRMKDLMQEFVVEMQKYTTDLPHDFPDLDKMIEEYDERKIKDNDPASAFNYSVCGETLEKELKTVIDNAVVVAQFKTAVKPYHREVNRWL